MTMGFYIMLGIGLPVFLWMMFQGTNRLPYDIEQEFLANCYVITGVVKHKDGFLVCTIRDDVAYTFFVKKSKDGYKIYPAIERED